jgi:hypothetical protein
VRISVVLVPSKSFDPAFHIHTKSELEAGAREAEAEERRMKHKAGAIAPYLF